MPGTQYNSKTQAALDYIINERMKANQDYSVALHHLGAASVGVGAILIILTGIFLYFAIQNGRAYGWKVTVIIFGFVLVSAGACLIGNESTDTKKAVAFEIKSKFNHCVSGCYLWFHYDRDEDKYYNFDNYDFSLISSKDSVKNTSQTYLASYFNAGNAFKIVSLDETGQNAFIKLSDGSIYRANLYMLLVNARAHMNVSSYSNLNTIPKGATRGFVNSQGL